MNNSFNELATSARAKLAEIAAADTAVNESRLVPLLKARGVDVKRGRQKNPARYTVKMKNASFGPVTLLDLENILAKLLGEGTSPDRA